MQQSDKKVWMEEFQALTSFVPVVVVLKEEFQIHG